jgi:SpoVK/Ycf46/Vps4 family AAA+-type ATPase
VTNFVAGIDAAVLRPGRFDLVIPIGPPDLRARIALWEAALASLLIAAVERTPASVTADIRERFGDEVDRFARV